MPSVNFIEVGNPPFLQTHTRTPGFVAGCLRVFAYKHPPSSFRRGAVWKFSFLEVCNKNDTLTASVRREWISLPLLLGLSTQVFHATAEISRTSGAPATDMRHSKSQFALGSVRLCEVRSTAFVARCLLLEFSPTAEALCDTCGLQARSRDPDPNVLFSRFRHS